VCRRVHFRVHLSRNPTEKSLIVILRLFSAPTPEAFGSFPTTLISIDVPESLIDNTPSSQRSKPPLCTPVIAYRLCTRCLHLLHDPVQPMTHQLCRSVAAAFEPPAQDIPETPLPSLRFSTPPHPAPHTRGIIAGGAMLIRDGETSAREHTEKSGPPVEDLYLPLEPPPDPPEPAPASPIEALPLTRLVAAASRTRCEATQ